jgi:hypothetical protein
MASAVIDGSASIPKKRRKRDHGCRGAFSTESGRGDCRCKFKERCNTLPQCNVYASIICDLRQD